MERVNRSVIFNWEAHGSGTRPRRQGFVIVTLQTVMTLRLRYSDRIREKNIEFRDAEVPANPNSERLVVWNETEQKLEDVIKSTIVEIREE
mgnify:CR=1 FL=1